MVGTDAARSAHPAATAGTGVHEVGHTAALPAGVEIAARGRRLALGIGLGGGVHLWHDDRLRLPVDLLALVATCSRRSAARRKES